MGEELQMLRRQMQAREASFAEEAAAQRRSAAAAAADAAARCTALEAEHATNMTSYREVAQRAESEAAAEEGKRQAAEAAIGQLEQTLAAERAKWNEWKAGALHRLESSTSDGSDREAALQVRIHIRVRARAHMHMTPLTPLIPLTPLTPLTP